MGEYRLYLPPFAFISSFGAGALGANVARKQRDREQSYKATSILRDILKSQGLQRASVRPKPRNELLVLSLATFTLGLGPG